MKLRVYLIPETGRKDKTYTEECANEYEARVKWANLLQLGLYIKSEQRFIAPWQIKGAELISEKESQ